MTDAPIEEGDESTAESEAAAIADETSAEKIKPDGRLTAPTSDGADEPGEAERQVPSPAPD